MDVIKMTFTVKKPVRLFAMVTFFVTFISYISAIQQDEIEYELRKESHLRKPRFVRIYSKPPGEDAEKRTGLKFHEHLKNALHGGSVGMEFDFKPLKKKFSGIFDTVQKYLPSIQQFKKKYYYHTKPSSVIPPKEKGTDNDIYPSIEDGLDDDYIGNEYKPRSGDKVPTNEEISAEFELDPRMQAPPEPNRLVDNERERLEEH